MSNIYDINFCIKFAKKRSSFNRINYVAVYKQASNDSRTEQSAMLNIVVCAILLAAVCCGQQEHLTCLRTDDVLNQQSSQSSQQAIRSTPGKRGAKGEMGSRGDPGQKGEPGVVDDHQLNLIRHQLNSFSQELEALKNQSEKNQQNKQLNYLLQEVGALKNQSKINGKLTREKECETSCSHQINLLRDELKSLSHEVEALKNQTHKIQQREQINPGSQEAEASGNQSNKYVNTTVPANGLYLPPHVYIYKLTTRGLSWQNSRKFCRNWGGDLAVHGLKTLENRKKVIRMLSIRRTHNWIGANYNASEGNWVWINGERASSKLFWRNRFPRFSSNSNCLALDSYFGSFDYGFADDHPCFWPIRGICEKKI